jgi:hypothetical protein
MNPGFVRFSRFARLSATLILFSTAACGSDDSAGPNDPRAIAKVSADSQTTAAGVKMSEPLVVLVTGSGGTPIAGTVVEWLIGNGGGSLSDSVSTTDANGRAQTTYTPGTAPGVARITASAGGLPSIFFTITLVAGPPTSLQPVGFGNPAAVAGSVLTLSVKLGDAFGNAISGKTVTWAAAGGSISATTSTTDAGGVASVTYTIGKDPGTYTLTATAAGVPPATITVKAI